MTLRTLRVDPSDGMLSPTDCREQRRSASERLTVAAVELDMLARELPAWQVQPYETRDYERVFAAVESARDMLAAARSRVLRMTESETTPANWDDAAVARDPRA